MRPRKLVAFAALTAAIALVALPGLAGSRTPRPELPLDTAAFRTISVNATPGGPTLEIGPLDSSYRSSSAVTPDSMFIEPGKEQSVPQGRASVQQPVVPPGSALKPPRYTLRGTATFYDNGTTAMRLPRGTVVIICGRGGCIERAVTDYGPGNTSRIVDLYRPDFFRVCGCPSWSGTTEVTVKVY